MCDALGSNFSSKTYEVYQNGKSRRYTLLFSVNGGAFAIFKFATEQQASDVFAALPFGMMIFTAIMFLDIWAFGHAIHEKVSEAFAKVGKLVLVVVCTLILTGWGLVALENSIYFGLTKLDVWGKTAVALLVAAIWLSIGQGLRWWLQRPASASS